MHNPYVVKTMEVMVGLAVLGVFVAAAITRCIVMAFDEWRRGDDVRD